MRDLTICLCALALASCVLAVAGHTLEATIAITASLGIALAQVYTHLFRTP